MKEQLIIFELDDQTYSVNAAQVQNIVPLQEIVTVPDAPPIVAGVINLREAVIPVVDLRSPLKLSLSTGNGSENTDSRKAAIIIVGLDGLRVGLIVDRVTEVTKIPEASIERLVRAFRKSGQLDFASIKKT
jgi:purine-binding chemotaxis protein CheW